jgi:hypothetical protein
VTVFGYDEEGRPIVPIRTLAGDDTLIVVIGVEPDEGFDED